MPPQAAGEGALDASHEASLEARLAEGGAAGRAAIVARLGGEIEHLNRSWANASPDRRRELILLVECLRAARRVVERSASFVNARGK
ncbi:hypothetical protein [Paraburkholderia sp. BCC1884]|uniref:hypothetical protein n=1 Tax=Paraburkholderia sp. BCC1884 TaxID=2562668 RepID=UPI001181DD0D|nr:hypothetical protein [Paraburkholderia sp. BCC1884]